MSANNFIMITVNNRVEMRDADTGQPYTSYTKKFNNIDDAIVYANEIKANEIVEYGITFERRLKSPSPGATS